jgi:hypothetical protein
VTSRRNISSGNGLKGLLKGQKPQTAKNKPESKTMKSRSIILTAILSLLVCVGLSCTALAGTGSAPVTVINTTTNPVPVTVANTTPVPVTGTVGVAENPARNAVQLKLLPIGGTSSITIPAGKILVIEFVSFEFVDKGPGPGSATLVELSVAVTDPLITGGSGSLNYQLAVPPANSANPFVTVGSQALRLYAQPRTTLSVSWGAQGGTGNFVLTVHISGYFVSTQ